MGTVPEHELAAVRNMTGYDQMLEIDRLCKTYGLDETTLRAMMASASGGAGERHLNHRLKRGTPRTRTSGS